MKTQLILPSGYSSSMENLLSIARKTRLEYPTEKIVLLGGLLHANPAKKELKQLGVDIIDIPYLGFNDFLKHLNPDTIVLTSPYGCDSSILKTLKNEHFRFFETLSSCVKKKIDFINNSKGKCNIIFVGNTNTIEASFLSKESKFSFIFYDVNDASKAKSVITQSKFNKKKTHILFQSELVGYAFDASLAYLKHLLPNAVIEEEISDENFDRKKKLQEVLQDGDIVLFVTDTSTNDKYLLDYYHLSTRKLLYGTIKDVKDAMMLRIDPTKKVILISDGSVAQNVINEIYLYFTYKSIAETLPVE